MSKVIVYSSSSCHYCGLVKNFLTENGVEYTERNISNEMDARKELMTKGYMSVPVVFIGDEVINGYDEEKMKAILSL